MNELMMLGMILSVLLVSGLVQGQQEYYDDGAEYDNASLYYTDYTDYSPGPETPSADLFNSFVNLDPNLVDANANFIQPETSADENISQDIAPEAISDLTNESDSENQAASENQADSESQADSEIQFDSEDQADSESVNLFGQESEIEEYTNEEQTSVDYDNQIDSETDNVNAQPFDQNGLENISAKNIEVDSLNEAENSKKEDLAKKDSATTNLDNTQIFDNDENSESPNNGFVITEVLQNTQDNLDTFNQNVNEEFPDTNTNEIVMSKNDENIPVFSPSSFSVSETSSTTTATSTTRETTTTKSFEGETTPENMCHEYRGRSNIVLDIFESIGTDFSQATNPRELPLYGQIGSDIQLELVSKPGNRFFQLSGKALNLVKVLDRDTTDLSSIVLQVTCTVLSTGKRRTIPVIVRVNDLNDNSPEFKGTPYTIDIPENTPVNSIVYRGIQAVDPDSGPNGLVQYTLIPGDGSESDGFGVFSINLPHQGIVTLNKPLDFETVSRYYLTLEARDQAGQGGDRATTTSIRVNVMDSDDLGPKFSHLVYTASVPRGSATGALDIRPEKIQAEDGDSLRSEILYSVLEGTPESYSEYFKVDRQTGVVRQIKVIDPEVEIESFELKIQAEENTLNRRREESQLIITVRAVDAYPPQLTVSSNQGYVTENSGSGTLILDSAGNSIIFTVSDRDLSNASDAPEYVLEFTSDLFNRNEKNELIVNSPNLDRDPPSQPVLIVQVVARENIENGKSSMPVSIKINLRDENDNPPLLPSFPPFTIEPGNTRRIITQLNATDLDEDDSLKYRIAEVSNNGKRIFYVNPVTGDLEVIGDVKPGDKYSILITVKDEADAVSETIIDVLVSQGPNLNPPVFSKLIYNAQVSEGAGKYTTVSRVQARDPEKGLVSYSVLSGDPESFFSIEESSGVIRVNKSLDREINPTFTLVVQGADEGGKVSSATVNIKIIDINDENPEFKNTPYSFRVKEGEVGAGVGEVLAEDKDADENGNVTYSLDSSMEEFDIDPKNGKITTKMALDFEKSQVHYVVVTAKDGGKQPRLATATATVLVQDTSDEIPFFPQPLYSAVVPENIKDFLVVTVKAEDKDSIAQINYRLVSGDLDKFRIDADTGELFTTQGLDFEIKKEHTLIIGTEQSAVLGEEGGMSTCTVQVSVQDVNDLPPEFIRLPAGNTIYVRNDAKINEVIGTLEARDLDGTEPGNIVRFELGEDSSEESRRYFSIDQPSGQITLLGDLSNEVYDEYRLIVKAIDQGTPSLFSSVEIIIRVEQVVTLPPNTGIGFTLLNHHIEVMENTPQEAVLKSVGLTGIPDRNINIRCNIGSAVDKNRRDVQELFMAEMNEKKECNLILARSGLDYETMTEYTVEMEIVTLSAFINPQRRIATIHLAVLDKNDNSPVFVYNQTYNDVIKENYLTIVDQNTKVGSRIFQVYAEDRDSGNFGNIQYDLSTETSSDARRYFKVDEKTGEVFSLLEFQENLEEENQDTSFNLIINARDNPGYPEDSKMSRTELVVNLLTRENLFVLVLRDTTPAQIIPRHEELADLLSSQTSLIVNIDRTMSMLSKDENDTCCVTSLTDSDVWFYGVDPETQELLKINQTLSEEKILSKQAQTSIKYIVTGQLHVQASDIHTVFAETPVTAAQPSTTSIRTLYSNQYSGYPAVLIAIGCLVFASSVIAILYLLFLYIRLRDAKSRAERMVIIPKYEPVFVEPNLKEYETQVLQMSVAIDDVDNDLRMDFNNRKQRGFDPGFHLDNVSYITHDTSSSGSSPVQEPGLTHSTFRAATVSGRAGRPVYRNLSSSRKVEVAPVDVGRVNPVYQDQENLIFHGVQDFNTSTPKKSHSFRAHPVDATTQL